MAAVGGLWPAGTAVAQPPAGRIADEVLRLLTYDTFAGVAAFSLPGPDRYSVVQGLRSASPGGVAAKAPELMRHTVDFFIPWPDVYVEALTKAFTDGAPDLPLPNGLSLDDILRALLTNDGTLPVSLVLALLVNLAATQVRPTSAAGPFAGSPFANLRHPEKAQAFQRIEQAAPDLVELVDANLPEPFTRSASGLLRYGGGLLLTLSTFTPYTEFGVFDRETRQVTRRPLGWDLSRYMPGRTAPADGWAEFLGYYQGRRAVSTAPEYGDD